MTMTMMDTIRTDECELIDTKCDVKLTSAFAKHPPIPCSHKVSPNQRLGEGQAG